jgi:pyruvate carboxylase
VESFGLGHRFNDIKEMYKTVNDMVGDIVKVTPSSKMVGDMAIFMVKNDLTPENINERAKHMAFPDSVVSYFQGMMGQPERGFPKELQKLVLKDVEPITARPGELLPPDDLEAHGKYLKEKYNFEPTNRDKVSYALYPDVFENYIKYYLENGDVSRMGSDVFFHGLAEGETSEIEVAEGRVLVVEYIRMGKLDPEGFRTVEFEVNGNRREIRIKDKTVQIKSEGVGESGVRMADPEVESEIGASIPGHIMKILAKEGDGIQAGQSLAVIEAMKMETNVISPVDGKVDALFVKEGLQVRAGQLLLTVNK